MKAIGATGADKEVLNQVFIKHLTKFIEAEEMWQILLNCDKGQGRDGGTFGGLLGGKVMSHGFKKVGDGNDGHGRLVGSMIFHDISNVHR